LVFENRGATVGVSNPHPHCQIYATSFVFQTMLREAQIADDHFRRTGSVLYRDCLAAEREEGRRLLAETPGAVAFVPYFARWAYEVHVAPTATFPSLAELDDSTRLALATVLRQVLIRYDNLWRMPFPYVLTFHQAPADGEPHDGFHFHIELQPPLRKPDLLKYLAGPEIGGGNFLSDTLPEERAAELRATPGDVHYLDAP
jgi:UDPglucose--hexose-1-phosphate uridylyltransferase